MPSATADLQFKIHGMDCADEIAVLRREVAPRAGGEDRLVFNLLESTMTLRSPPADLSPQAVEQAVARTGMRAELLGNQAVVSAGAGRWERHGRMILTALCGLFTAAGFLTHAWMGGGIAEALGSEAIGVGHHLPGAVSVLYALAIACGGFYLLPKAWLAARRLRPDIYLLMTLAVLGAVLIGEGFEAATVTFLFSLSLALETWSIGRARRAVAALLSLSPPLVRLKGVDGKELEASPELVEPGSIFIVRPGERIALDGEVVSGTSAVNQAPITGESLPVARNPGDSVYAGTINGDGALDVRSTRRASETTLAQIVRLVRGAQAKRALSEQWVDRFGRVYTPSVMAIAAVVAVVPALFGGDPARGFYRALVLLVIACPCALVISTPVSIVAGLAASARQGVLIKGGRFLELAAGVRAVVFDKTGTLTKGELDVAQVIPLAGHSEAELIGRGAAMEARSDHPIARAIVAYARSRGTEPEPAEALQAIPGKGVTARFNGKSYWLGSHRYLEERGQEAEESHRLLEAMAETGMTVVVVGSDAHVCGLIGLRDALRPGMANALRALREAGVERLVMLTGDNAQTASVVARMAGVDEHAAELLPQDKVAAIEQLVGRYGVVAMVGDGVNDAPAMARASVGIAMGAMGSDAAIETADIALMGDDLSKLPWLVRHSRRTGSIIRQNIIFSLLVKVVFVILAFAGAATLWSAIAADMGASLLVIFNGLRLLRQPRSTRPRPRTPWPAG